MVWPAGNSGAVFRSKANSFPRGSSTGPAPGALLPSKALIFQPMRARRPRSRARGRRAGGRRVAQSAVPESRRSWKPPGSPPAPLPGRGRYRGSQKARCLSWGFLGLSRAQTKNAPPLWAGRGGVNGRVQTCRSRRSRSCAMNASCLTCSARSCSRL
jgi:hypothetical protein